MTLKEGLKAQKVWEASKITVITKLSACFVSPASNHHCHKFKDFDEIGFKKNLLLNFKVLLNKQYALPIIPLGSRYIGTSKNGQFSQCAQKVNIYSLKGKLTYSLKSFKIEQTQPYNISLVFLTHTYILIHTHIYY